MNHAWQKRLLFIAAAWNLLGGASALLDPAQHFAQMYTAALSLNDPLQMFFYRAVWINVMAWGMAYVLAAMLPATRAAVLAAGAAGKCAYFVACLALFSSGVGKGLVVVAGVVDFVFAALFAFLLVQRYRPGTHAAANVFG